MIPISSNARLFCFILALVLITSALFGGYAYGVQHVRRDAVDNSSGTYVMDKYGNVDWHWANSPTAMASK